MMKRPESTQTFKQWIQNRERENRKRWNKLFSLGTFYAPTKNIPKSIYFTRCAAVIDAILELYPASYNLYSQIVRQWDTPDCQAVIASLKDELDKHHKNRGFMDAFMSQQNGTDWETLESLVCDFVKRYCNRPSDIKKGKPKLRAEDSPYLTFALAFHCLVKYLGLNIDDLNVYRGEAKGIMEQRKHSRKRDEIVKRLKERGLELHYGENIRETAHLWVRVRLLRKQDRILRPLTIDEFAASIGISKRKFLDRLDPFDRAVNYDRHPG